MSEMQVGRVAPLAIALPPASDLPSRLIDEVAKLALRIAELERRLQEVERKQQLNDLIY
jgi:hypothetical protein